MDLGCAGNSLCHVTALYALITEVIVHNWQCSLCLSNMNTAADTSFFAVGDSLCYCVTVVWVVVV